jgi:hypothetical protein
LEDGFAGGGHVISWRPLQCGAGSRFDILKSR